MLCLLGCLLVLKAQGFRQDFVSGRRFWPCGAQIHVSGLLPPGIRVSATGTEASSGLRPPMIGGVQAKIQTKMPTKLCQLRIQ